MIPRLQCLTQDGLEGRDHLCQARAACRGGARWIQLRRKNAPPGEWEKTAEGVLAICREFGARLIINDSPEIARAVGAQGVHLGAKDTSIADARALLGPDAIIGGTANTPDDVERCLAQGADYVGLGPFRPTTTKKDLSPILGNEGMRRAARLFPQARLFAIGGVRLQDVGALRRAGIYGVAVASAINTAPDPAGAAWAFATEMENLQWRRAALPTQVNPAL